MSTALQTGQFAAALVPQSTAESLQASFDELVRCQDEQIANGEPASPIPLMWVALAESVGLVVDLATGRIVDGPRAKVGGM